jgi:hypothetical protein
MKGLGTDLTGTYIPAAKQIREGKGISTELTYYHGLVYPALLVGLGYFFPQDKPVPGWQYFNASKVISAFAAGVVIFLVCHFLGITWGGIAALLLLVNMHFFEFAFSPGTDMLSVALILATAGLIDRQRLYQFVIAGLLFSLASCMRYEYLILLLPALLYIKNPRRILVFAGSALLVMTFNFIISGFPDNTGNMAYKYYRSTTFAIDYFEWDNFPDLSAVITHAPIIMVKAYWQDVFRLIRDLGSGAICAPCLIALALVPWRERVFKFIGLAIVLHVLVVSLMIHYAPRFYLAEIVVCTILGIWAAKEKAKMAFKSRYAILMLLLFIPFTFSHLAKTENKAQELINSDGVDYVRWRELVLPGVKVLARRPQAAFIAGGQWHYWPPDVSDLYSYCLEAEVDFIIWGIQEAKLRTEWKSKLHNPREALPEFIGLDYTPETGGLYYVNKLNSHIPAVDSGIDSK